MPLARAPLPFAPVALHSAMTARPAGQQFVSVDDYDVMVYPGFLRRTVRAPEAASATCAHTRWSPCLRGGWRSRAVRAQARAATAQSSRALLSLSHETDALRCAGGGALQSQPAGALTLS